MLAEVQESTVEEKLSCYHCGDECLIPVQHQDKTFCCHGCKTVYEILAESGLSDYYSIDETPGFKQLSHQLRDKYDYLDNSEIVHQLVDFKSEDFCRITFTIPTIHCSSCIWLLENLQGLSEGIISSQVNFPRKILTISFDQRKISLKRLVETLAAVGYEPDISLEKKTDEKQNKKIGSLSLKIGVAAFCFGNIMLLSFPEYLGIDTDLDHYLKQIFLYLNFGLALPVVMFSATEYYESAWKGLRHGYANIDVPIVLGVAALFFRSSYEIFSGTGAGYLDSLAGLIFFLLIGKWFQSKTYMHLSFDRDYKSYFPLAAKVEVKDGFKLIMIKDLSIGDVVHVRNAEVVPADSVLLDDVAEIDYSFVTGESRKILKEQKDFLYAGGRNVGKTIRIQVQKEVSQSFLTSLWNNKAFNKGENHNVRLVDRISKYFTFVIVAVALASALFWHLAGSQDPFLIFTSVLIVACPCALALATPFTYGNVLRILGRNKFYLKNADIPELFMNVSHIIFDKTGTLTDISKYEVVYEGKPLLDSEWVHLKMAVENSTHPLSKRILDFLKNYADSGENIEGYHEIPGSGIWAKIGNDRLAIGSASWVGKSDGHSLRKAESSVHITINNEYVGCFALKPAYKSGLTGMLAKVAKYFKLGVLSGDHSYDIVRLKEYFPASTPMIFEQSPEDKLAYIEKLQKKGNSVIMLGDGLNDAAALKQANIGIAVTENASNFTPSCDAILEGNKMNHLHHFLSFIRMSKNVVIASFVLSFLYNFFGLAFAVSGNLTPIFAAILMPISSISVVAFSTAAVNLLGKKFRLV